MLLWTLNIIMYTISGHHTWLKLCILCHTVPIPAPCVIASCVYLVGPVYSTRHAGADFVSLKFLSTCPSTLSLPPSLPPSSFLPPSLPHPLLLPGKCADCCKTCCYSTPFGTIFGLSVTVVGLVGFLSSSIYSVVKVEASPDLKNQWAHYHLTLAVTVPWLGLRKLCRE